MHERNVEFLTLENGLTTCVLISEDLARQEPVADLLRAIGPNLVVTLLMDGPQIRERWTARYAAVLAEDPGCSVLTLTSLGMASLSRLEDPARDRSRTIAWWRDVHFGQRELALREEESAAVLRVVRKSGEEFTADGRGDGGAAHYAVYAGFRGLVLPSIDERGPSRGERRVGVESGGRRADKGRDLR